MPKEISIGERIKEVFDKREMSISRFAELLHCDYSNVHNIFRRKKIDIKLLLDISKILNHDFIKEYGYSSDTDSYKISFVVELCNANDETIKTILNTFKQLNIKVIHENTTK